MMIKMIDVIYGFRIQYSENKVIQRRNKVKTHFENLFAYNETLA